MNQTEHLAALKAQAERLISMIQFLQGEVGLDGTWFGDNPIPSQGSAKYWWRKPLRRDAAVIASLVNAVEQLAAENAEKDAELVRLREALDSIASCESHFSSDVVSVARAALQTREGCRK